MGEIFFDETILQGGIMLKKMTSGPVGELLEHLEAFTVLAKEGRVRFRGKKDVGAIFVKLDRTGYIFQQATSGTMYDYRRKIERNVWNAAISEYDMYMDQLKTALLAAVDEAEQAETAEEETPEETEQAAEEEELSLKELMARAEAADAEEEAAQNEEAIRAAAEKEKSAATTKMTEADCRELWRIYRAMLTEYKAMKHIAERWIADNPEKGCLGVTLMIFSLPLVAVATLFALIL